MLLNETSTFDSKFAKGHTLVSQSELKEGGMMQTMTPAGNKAQKALKAIQDIRKSRGV